MTFDSTITIEGAATALGVLGAASGYLINLIRSWRNDRKRDKIVGTRLVVLELLERNLGTGLTEDQLWTLYSADETAARRKYYRATSPSKLNRLQFERELRQLQLDHLIDLAGADHYYARVHPRSTFDNQELAESTLARSLSTAVPRQKLRETAIKALEVASSQWEKTAAMRLLLQLGDESSIKAVVAQLNSADQETALGAAEVLAKYVPPDTTGVTAARAGAA